MVNSLKGKMILRDERGKNFLREWGKSENHSLFDIYARPSIYKQKAFKLCWERFCDDDTARQFRIISYNKNFFVVAWMTIVNQHPYLFVDTGRNEYLVPFTKGVF